MLHDFKNHWVTLGTIQQQQQCCGLVDRWSFSF